MTLAPIVLFTYNRPIHTRATIEALRANIGAEDTVIHIYSDGPKTPSQSDSVRQVRSYLRSVDGFRSVAIIERERNMGLAASVIAGVTEILSLHPAAIVMEDDMITSRIFLSFMNVALQTYAGRSDIFSVTGYNYPLPIPRGYPDEAYLSYRSSSWGWGTWSDRWSKVDWKVSDFSEFMQDSAAQARLARGGADLLPMLRNQLAGKLDSWSIRFDYAHYKHDALCLHPTHSKLYNIGFDGSGVHCGVSAEYDVELDEEERSFNLRPDLQIDPVILEIFNKRFCQVATSDVPSQAKSFLKRALGRIGRMVRVIQ